MRPWQVILVLVALLATFDYIVNDGDGVREVVDWLVRTGLVVAGSIHRLVMSVFGQ